MRKSWRKASTPGGGSTAGLPPRAVSQEVPPKGIEVETLPDIGAPAAADLKPPEAPPQQSGPIGAYPSHASAAPFLAALSEAQRAAIDRAKAVWEAAGGDVDHYTVVMMHRFCEFNKGNEKKIDAQIRKTVAWRTSGQRFTGLTKSTVATIRAELIAGKKLCEYDEFMRGLGMVSFLPYLGMHLSDLQLVEYM